MGMTPFIIFSYDKIIVSALTAKKKVVEEIAALQSDYQEKRYQSPHFSSGIGHLCTSHSLGIVSTRGSIQWARTSIVQF